MLMGSAFMVYANFMDTSLAWYFKTLLSIPDVSQIVAELYYFYGCVYNQSIL